MIEKIVANFQETTKKFSEKIPEFSKDKENSKNIPDFKDYSSGITRSEVDKDVEDKKIEEKSPYSKEINENITTEEELNVYLEAELEENTVNDKPALTRGDIDCEQVDENTGETNLERMEKGKPPLDKDGNPVELHHIGQESDSPLAELSRNEHRGKGNDSILHEKTQDTLIDRKAFEKEKTAHWKARAEEMKQG